jgi:uncharacterized damage-inducible protein DinB
MRRLRLFTVYDADRMVAVLEGHLMQRFDGREMTKLDLLRFAAAHEMYHRGQLTVYERLLNIKPALTTRFEKLFAQAK